MSPAGLPGTVPEFRVVRRGDEALLVEMFGGIDRTFFRPHPFTAAEADRIAGHSGRDVYALLLDGSRPLAYGLLRGWDEGYPTPSLGVAVHTGSQGRGLGRTMMSHLHDVARREGSHQVRLRVHPRNTRARHLYESLGYRYDGEDRAELVMRLPLDPPADPSA